MNPIVAIHPEFSARFVMTLAHFLWQGAAIGLVAVALGAVLRRASARLRYGIFLIALLGMALCPPVTFLIIEPGTLPTPSAELGMGPIDSGMGTVDIEGDRTYGTYRTDRSDQPVRSDGSDPVLAASTEAKASFEATAPQANLKPADLELSSAPPAAGDWRDYTPYLILAYLAGVLVMLARLGLGLAGGGSLRKRAERITNSAILEAVRRNAQQLRLRAVPVVAYCQRVAVPTVVGVIRPMILLPASLATGMPPLQVELLLLHELTHIRRYDHVLNILQRIIEAMLFFHPAVWYVSHRIRVEREHCCDDLVIALGGERQAYAESLVAAAALASGMRLSPAALAATGKPSQLRKRIHRLLEEPAPPVRLVRGGWVFAVLAIAALVAGATQFSGQTVETRDTQEEPASDLVLGEPVVSAVPDETLQIAEAPVSDSVESTTTERTSNESPADTERATEALSEQELNAKLTELSIQTQDPDWWLRKVAVQQLGELPHSTGIVQSVIGMLKDEDARVQAAAAEALAKQGDPQAIKHLVAALKEESEVREAAAEALTHFKHEDVMPLLTLAARDEDMTVRLGAVLGLGKQNTAEAAAILVGLLPEFYDEDPARRGPLPPRPVRSRSNSLPVNPAELRPTGAAVAEALSAMDPAIARPALLDAATSTEWQTLMQTALVIGASDMQRVPDLQNALLGMLKHERKDVRAAAAQVLSETVKARVAEGESASPEVLAALEPLLRDPNRAITWIAADALRGGGWQPSSTEERAWFLVAIGQGQEASALGPVALEPFVHALNADSSRAFDQQGEETNPPRDIVQWLSELDDPGKVEPLISVLTRFGDNTTMEVASVLGTTGDRRAFEPLAALLGHLNPDVQVTAVWALGKLKDPRAVDPLIEMLNHASDRVREQAIEALGEIGDPRAASAVRPFLESENDGAVFEAAKALGAFKDAESAPRIAELYRKTPPDSGSNEVYVDALVSIDGSFAEQTFMEILNGDSSEKKREQATVALGKLKSAQAIPLLREAILYDTSDSVKRAAIEALGNVGGEEATRALVTMQDVQDVRTRNLYYEFATNIAKSFSVLDNPISSDALAKLYQDFKTEPYLAAAHLTAATTLAKRGDPRGKTMLQELQNIPETRIAATNALQELAQQSEPEADTATPADAGDQTDQTDRSDRSDLSTAESQPATQLPGPRLQFRWVVEGEDAVGKTVLPAPTEDEPDRTLVVGDDVVFYEGDVASAITKKEPNRDAYAVFFVTTEDGEKRLWNATEQNQGKRLAIIFDGRVLSAPVVQSPIGKSGQITGDLTEEEAEVIARAINDALGDDGGESMPKPTLYDEEVVLPDGREPILDRDAAEKRGYKIEEAPGGDEPFLYDKLLRREGEVMSQDLLKPVVPEVVEPR